MQERAKRLTIAVMLTAADVAIFHNYSGAIWQAWGQDPLAKGAFLSLLGLWIASAIVIWGHISNDLRQTLRERNLTLCSDSVLVPKEPRRDTDV
jgi:hypothetical protein